MIARLVKKGGSYSLTRDEKGVYFLLDANAREVAMGRDMESLDRAACIFSDTTHTARICAWCKLFLGVTEGNIDGHPITHGICPDCARNLEGT